MHKPIVHLVYALPQALEEICNKIVDQPIEKIKTVFDSYSPIKVTDTIDEIVTIPHILYDDIKINMEYMKIYEKLVDEYGQELIDIIVIKDTKPVMEKIISAINLIFDSMTKPNDILIHAISSIQRYDLGGKYLNHFYGATHFIDDVTNSKYPELIYYAIQKNFNIKYQSPTLNKIRMVIIERRNENGNGN